MHVEHYAISVTVDAYRTSTESNSTRDESANDLRRATLAPHGIGAHLD
jgi:hypothetical protein